MKKNYCLLIISFLLTLPVLLINGAKNDPTHMRDISIADGLSGNMVDAIYPDSAGYVWIGTDAGVDRFDGNHIVSLALTEKLSEEGCRFYDFAELPGGRLFAASAKGIFEIDRKEMRLKDPGFSSTVGFVRDLSAGGDGKTLWAAGKDGLYEINTISGAVRKILIVKNALSKANDIRGVHYDRSRNGVWAVSKSNVCFYDIKTGKISVYDSGTKDKFQSVTGHGDMLYMATRESGVWRFDKRNRSFLPPLSFGNNIIMSVTSTPDGRLVVGVDCDGVYVYSIEEQKILHHYDTLDTDMPSNSVYYALIDKRGILWIGYYQAGFSYTPVVSPFLEHYSSPVFPELQNKEVRAFGIEPGYKLIGTRRGLYFIDENLGKGRIFTRPEIQSDIIFSIHKYRNLYYIGTYRGGIYTFDPASQTLSPLAAGPGLKKNISCWDIVEDGKGNLWFGTSAGIYILNPGGEWKNYNSKNSQLPAGNVYYIFFDSTGRGWIATDRGLAIWNGKEIISNSFPENFLAARKYSSIYEDKQHNLYFIPMRGDIFRSNLGLTEFSNITLDPEKKIVVSFMTESPSGKLLLGTNMGLGYLEKDKLNMINSMGMIANPLFMTGRPVSFGGTTWMGNGMGLVKLNHNKEREFNRKEGRNLNISLLNADGKDITSSLKHIAGTDVNNITIRSHELEIGVTDFSYVNPENAPLEYMLEGVQKKWKKIPSNEIIRLENLSGGSNRLLIRRQGEPESEITLDIIVKTGHAWLYITILLLLMAAGASYLYLRNKKDQERKKEEDGETGKKRYVSSRISEEECARLHEEIERVMTEQKPYLNTEFKIQDLANLVGSSSFSLSYLFNQYLKIGYINYVNSYRIEEFKKIVAEEESSKFTLTGLATKCGFSSRASFFRHFKAATGQTPSQYIKEANKDFRH